GCYVGIRITPIAATLDSCCPCACSSSLNGASRHLQNIKQVTARAWVTSSPRPCLPAPVGPAFFREPTSSQGGIFFGIGFAIERGRNEKLRGHGITGEMLQDK